MPVTFSCTVYEVELHSEKLIAWKRPTGPYSDVEFLAVRYADIALIQASDTTLMIRANGYTAELDLGSQSKRVALVLADKL